MFIGAALNLASSPTTPIATADEPKGKQPAASTPGAAAAANAFLDSLDAKQREKSMLEFGSAKKPNWSNLP
jgi:hypothetical protein